VETDSAITVSAICPLVEYGRADNILYLSPLAYQNWEQDTFEKLKRLAPSEEVLVPASFLMSPGKDELINRLNQLAGRRRLMIGVDKEELEFVEDVRKLLAAGWALDLLLERPIDWELERRLALYREQNVRLVLLVNRSAESQGSATIFS
jgi:hypothetical protein